jgi:hypothetical protein
MRSGSYLLVAVSLLATVAACNKVADPVVTEFEPSSTLARVRVVNATNTTFDMSANGTEWIGHNLNIRHGVSRCFEVAPGSAPVVRDSATKTSVTGLPTTFEAGKSYALLIYQTSTSATAPHSYLAWETDSYIPPTDSGGLRFLNASPNAGTGVDVYLNIPNSTAVPPMNAANRVATNVPLSTATNYLNLPSDVTYQVRITRTGSTTSANTLIDGTTWVLAGESSTYILGIPSLTSTAFRSAAIGGC